MHEPGPRRLKSSSGLGREAPEPACGCRRLADRYLFYHCGGVVLGSGVRRNRKHVQLAEMINETQESVFTLISKVSSVSKLLRDAIS